MQNILEINLQKAISPVFQINGSKLEEDGSIFVLGKETQARHFSPKKGVKLTKKPINSLYYVAVPKEKEGKFLIIQGSNNSINRNLLEELSKT